MKKKMILLFLLVFIVIASVIFLFYIDKYNTKEENKVSSNSKENKEEQELIDVFNKYCEITVYLNADVSDDEVENIKNELNKKDYISNIKLVSSEDALEDLKGRFPDNEEIFEGYEENNIFPSSYELGIKFETIEDVMNDEYVEKIKEELKEISNIEEVLSNNETMKSIYENFGVEALKDALENGIDSLKNYEIKNTVKNSIENNK